MIIRRLRILIAVLAGVISLQAWSQTKGFDISGTVKDENGEAVELALVSLNSTLGTSTGRDGKFVIKNVPAGTYQYQVSFVGYETVQGTLAVKTGKETLNVTLRELGLQLEGVTVTAKQVAMGSKSVVGEEAIRHIQPKSVDDLLQLVPGNLTENPNLNKLAQAHIREIDGSNANAMGTSVVVDGTPLSNNANLQVVAPTRNGSSVGLQSDGMNEQGSVAGGVDLRTVSTGVIEAMEVIRGIPSVEYGNLTSGVVLVKTKSGRTPLEAKVQADAFSKLAFVGKGFGLKDGAGLNFGLDWSQSWADTRKHYQGYDRITGTAGYSNHFGPWSVDVRGAFYSNINNYKDDPQFAEKDLHYKNSNVGGRLSVSGKYKPAHAFITSLDYKLSGQASRQLDKHDSWVSNPYPVITDARESGLHEARFNASGYQEYYQVEGKPINLYAQLMANKYVQLGETSFTTFKLGGEYTYDANKGAGLTFDIASPPQSSTSHTLRPRAYKDIPALNTVAGFFSDRLNLDLANGMNLSLEAGLRMNNLFLNKQKSGRQDGNITTWEPRVNASVGLLSKKNNSLFDELAITGGFGIASKMPTLLYLYPDNSYFDNISLAKYGNQPQDRLALVTTDVVTNTQNPNLKPAKTNKWEIGTTFRIGKASGFVTYFNEHHRHEFGFQSQLIWQNFYKFDVPATATDLQFYPQTGEVTYQDGGNTVTANKRFATEMFTWGMPANTSRSTKHGIEYGLDLGEWKPLRTSLSINGAWFHINRTSETTSLSYVNEHFGYVGVLPAGKNGSVRDRFNSSFRFITHIPAVRMIFTTTVQVVWYESSRDTYEDADGNKLYTLKSYSDKDYLVVQPLGYYDAQGAYHLWQASMIDDANLGRLIDRQQTYAYNKDTVHPWALLNFRFTKEIGRVAELSFIANNFTNTSKWHTNKNTLGKSQLYPDIYFGAELKLKL